MKWTACALLLGFFIDLIVGDPHGFPHPVIAIGKLIAVLDKALRNIFPKTPKGEKAAGGVLWIIVVFCSFAVPAVILWVCSKISIWLWLFVNAIMCWTILATKSLRDESMKVHDALLTGDLEKSRYAVSMIVGRDTARLDLKGVTKAAVETVAENASDGVIAPMIFMAIGGAPLGFLYKGVNTMDSMLGYTDPPYTNIGFFPAKLDDVFNYIPARISGIVMLLAGGLIGLNFKNGWKIFCRDRYNHASPNSAQTESVCAGLLGVQLAGDAWYHGVLHKKQTIGDPLREIQISDIPLVCKLLYATAALMLFICLAILMLL